MRDRVCDEAFLRKVSVFIQAAAIDCRLPRPPHSRRWTRTIILTTEVHRNGSLDSAVGILRARSACFTSFSIGRTRHLKNLDSAFLLSWRRCRETAKNLLRFPKVTIREVLPALAKLLRGSDSPDARFLALKLTCDSMLPLLALQPVKIDYENARSNAEEMREKLRGDANSVCQIDADDKRYLTESLRMDFLPSCPALLMDEDPITLRTETFSWFHEQLRRGGGRERQRARRRSFGKGARALCLEVLRFSQSRSRE